ncbi:hypothetical protein EEL30_21525 [Brevibacillus laterosporus]|uniref:Uncharacterized protein n=1 Tax=Brevibacillus laterosporus TaxID=1465 RepID=A0A518VCB3_BRELA|nr:hypothetical protein EEL30_21525 [Brevibacillus laterosporus]
MNFFNVFKRKSKPEINLEQMCQLVRNHSEIVKEYRYTKIFHYDILYKTKIDDLCFELFEYRLDKKFYLKIYLEDDFGKLLIFNSELITYEESPYRFSGRWKNMILLYFKIMEEEIDIMNDLLAEEEIIRARKKKEEEITKAREIKEEEEILHVHFENEYESILTQLEN